MEFCPKSYFLTQIKKIIRLLPNKGNQKINDKYNLYLKIRYAKESDRLTKDELNQTLDEIDYSDVI